MKYFDWDEQKNAKIKQERDVCFEDVQTALEEGKLLDNIAHPNQLRYKGQRIFIIEINNYAFVIPFVEDETKIFLKTVYPSRKFTNEYIIKRRKL